MERKVSDLAAALQTDQLIYVLMHILAFKDQEGRADPEDRQLYDELFYLGEGYTLQAAA